MSREGRGLLKLKANVLMRSLELSVAKNASSIAMKRSMANVSWRKHLCSTTTPKNFPRTTNALL